MQHLDISTRIKYLIFLFFTLDIFFMGSGQNYAVFGLSTRKLLFGLFCLFSAMTYFWSFNRKPILSSYLLLGLVGFILFWVVIIPLYFHGNISYSIADALPIIAPGIYLITDDFSNREGIWVKIRAVVFYSLLIFVALHIILYGMSLVSPQFLDVAGEFLRLLWEPKDGTVELFVFLTPLDNGVLRVYFGSSFLLLLGLYFSVEKYRSPIRKCSICRIAFFLLVVLALWATNTRSLLLGAVVFIFALPLFARAIKRIQWNFLTVTLLIAAPFFLSFMLIPTFDPQMLTNLGVAREGSDDIRADQFWPLFEAFLASPLFGQGFGSNAALIRSEEAPYSYELSILALFMKIGIVGFLFATAILSISLNSSMPKKGKFFPKEIAPLYALYCSYIFSCFFNPYMFGFFGTFFSLFILYESSFLIGSSKDD